MAVAIGRQLFVLGLAFSSCILVFEGSRQFEWRLLAAMPELLGLAHAAGVALQCITSTSEQQTQVRHSTHADDITGPLQQRAQLRGPWPAPALASLVRVLQPLPTSRAHAGCIIA
jgi:hypothetical protein